MQYGKTAAPARSLPNQHDQRDAELDRRALRKRTIVSFDMPGSAGPPRRPAAPAGPTRGRGKVLLPTLVVLGVLVLLFSIFVSFYTDLLWFRSVDYASVFTASSRPRRCCSCCSACCSPARSPRSS